MKKLLLILLIPLLSPYFVTTEQYEEDIAELEQRIEALESEEPQDVLNEYVYEDDIYRVTIYLEHIREDTYQATSMEFCEIKVDNECETYYADKHTEYTLEELEVEMNNFIETVHAVRESLGQ